MRMFAHSAIPSLSIPQQLPRAYNIFRERANGAHVVMRMLWDAFNIFKRQHICNPMSLIPQQSDASNFLNVFANGLHVVIFGLLYAYKIFKRRHIRNP